MLVKNVVGRGQICWETGHFGRVMAPFGVFYTSFTAGDGPVKELNRALSFLAYVVAVTSVALLFCFCQSHKTAQCHSARRVGRLRLSPLRVIR